MLADEFPADVRHYLRKVQRLSEETVADLAQQYRAKQRDIEGMPPISSLTGSDAPAVELLPAFSATQDKNWEGLKARAERCKQFEDDAGNIFLPRWNSKSDDKKSPWVNEFGAISDENKLKVLQLCRESAPVRNAPLAQLLDIAPVSDPEFMFDICRAVYRSQKHFIRDMGESTDVDFRWSTTVTLLAGLGTTALRTIFSLVRGEEDLDFWATCSQEELVRDIIKCQQISGYPVGLFRCDWVRLQNTLRDEVFVVKNTDKVHTPECLVGALLLHILKHARYSIGRDVDGNRIFNVIVMFRGSSAVFPIPYDNVYQPFLGRVNKGVCQDMCSVLKISAPAQANEKDWTKEAVSRVFSVLRPIDLCECRPLTDKNQYIAAPTTVVTQCFERKSVFRWVDPGVAIKNVAVLNDDTGDIEKDVLITGPDAIMYDWPRGLATDADVLNWRSQLPDKIEPQPASVTIHQRIKNINPLGEMDGYSALINAMMTIALARKDLAGSPVGSICTLEFPFMYVLPTGHTMDTTTNQGKTNFGRLLGRALVPNLEVTQMSMLTSAPAQRSLGVPLDKFGTAIFDEFQIPSDSAHFLNSSGLQALATGSTATPGQAGKDHGGYKLRFPLILVSKVAVAPEDIVNRSIPTFLDVLNDATRASGAELTEIMTMTAGTIVRLSHLMWMRKNNVIEKIKELTKLDSPNLRFNGHYAVACQFADAEDVNRYLTKAREQMRRQYTEAERSGLVDQVGMSLRFDPKWFFNACSDNTMQMLMMTSTGNDLGKKTIEALVREMVEDGNTRRFDTVLNSYRMKEYGVAQAVINSIGKDGWVKPGWKLSYISKDESKIMRGGSSVAYVTVERHEERT